MRRAEPNRARLRVIATLGAIAALQFVFGLLLDYRIPLLRFPSARAVAARVAASPAGPDVILVGSSRFADGVYESVAANALRARCGLSRPVNVLNAAVPGGDSVAQQWMISRLLDAGARLRLIVLEISPEFLNWYNFFAGANGIRLLRWDDLHRHGRAVSLTPQFGRALTGRLVPVYQYREELWKLVRGDLKGPLAMPTVAPVTVPSTEPAPVIADDDPSAPPVVSPEVRAKMQEVALQLRTSWLRSYRIAPLYVETFRDTIRRCREVGCDVVLVTPPVSTLHRAEYTPAIDASYRETIAGLDCRHVDCREWLDDGWFYDSHHLNSQGAARFSVLLSRRVLAPLWERRDVAAR